MFGTQEHTQNQLTAHLLDGMHEPTNFLCHFPLELILFANESRVRTTARIGTRHRDGRRVGVMSVSIRRSIDIFVKQGLLLGKIDMRLCFIVKIIVCQVCLVHVRDGIVCTQLLEALLCEQHQFGTKSCPELVFGADGLQFHIVEIMNLLLTFSKQQHQELHKLNLTKTSANR
jgi:hypothetical protein